MTNQSGSEQLVYLSSKEKKREKKWKKTKGSRIMITRQYGNIENWHGVLVKRSAPWIQICALL